MFKVMDSENLFIPIKSGFLTAAKAYTWAKKNLPKNSCNPFIEWNKQDHKRRYFIQSY